MRRVISAVIGFVLSSLFTFPAIYVYHVTVLYAGAIAFLSAWAFSDIIYYLFRDKK